MEPTNQNQLDNLFDLQIDAKAVEHLKTAATWARIVSIIAFTSSGFAILEVFWSPGFITVAQKVGQVFAGIIGLGVSILIYIFLYKFGNNMNEGLGGMNQELFNKAFRDLKTFFKIGGILLIIFLSCAVLFLLFALLAGLFMSAGAFN